MIPGAAGGWALQNGSAFWLAAVVAVGCAAALSGWRSGRGLAPSRRVVLMAVRLLAVGLAAIAVLRPAREVELTRARRAPLALVVDTSRSMVSGPDAPGPALVRWLERAAPAQALGAYYRPEFYGLGEPAPAVDPASLGRGGAFSGTQTPLGLTLEGIARLHPETAAVVLLSDGRDTERPGTPPSGLPFPVYPVVAATAPARDLWVEAVETPPVAFIRTPVEVRVRLGLSGMPPGPAAVTLLEAGKPLRSETAQVGPDGGEVSLSFTPTRTGRKAFRVEVTPWAGEVTTENNRAQFELNVIRDKTRVLLVAGTPTWDVKFLRRRLRQDPGVDLITFLILRTPQDLALVPQEELSLIPFPTRELFSEELPSFDAVIFANFDFAPYVPRHYLENVAQFVREAGGGFAMLGGDRSFTAGGYEGSPLQDILPVDFSGAAPGRAYLPNRFRPRLTESGVNHPLLQWRPDPEENRALWNGLPELEGMNWVLRARPDAVVLAENPQARNEYGPQPVIALAEVGAGRTLAVATDSLWRWTLPNAGAGGDDSVYRDFWTRALRWLVHDPEMELVRLSLPPGELREGQRVRFRARVLDRSYSPARGASVTGWIAPEEGEALALEWREGAPGEYVSDEVTLAGQGLWRAEARAEARASAAGAFLGRDAVAFPVAPASPEGLRLGTDLAYLEALAEGSGGRVFSTEDEGLLDLLGERGRSQVEVVGRRVEEVWASGWVLTLSVLLFGADWALRRFWE